MKPPKAGGEIDSWCTKCRRWVGHRIIAMVGPKPARVECLSCSSQHNYRAHPPGEKAEGKGSAKSASGPKSIRVSGHTRAAQEALAREKTWEKAIAGRGVSDFRRYKVSETFHEGDLIRHTKFGDGVVTRVLDAHKVEILFKDEPRTLAQALVD